MAKTVIGSGPFEEDVPESRMIFAVNGSVAHLPEKRIDSSNVSVIFVNGHFETSEARPEADLLVKNSPYSKIILRESLLGLDYPSSNARLQNLAEELRLLTYREMFSMWASRVGVLRTLLHGVHLKSLPAYFSSAINSMRRQKDFVERIASVFLSNGKTKLSSGVLAVLLASSMARPRETIYVFGITLSRNRYAYHLSNSQIVSRSKGHNGHLVADIFILSKLYQRCSGKLVIGDPQLRELIEKTSRKVRP